MKTALLFAALAAAHTAHASDLSCDTPAVEATVKMIVAENVIAVAEHQMAMRHSLDRATPQEEIDSGRDKLTSALRLKNARRIQVEATDGFPVWCKADAVLITGPAYALRVQYRSRPSNDHPGGVHTQVKAAMPEGQEGFNALIALRRSMVLLIR